MSKICHNPQCSCYNQGFPDVLSECPICKTPFAVPHTVGVSLNLGDANAISGGINMSDNHSVNNNTVNTSTSNVDSHNVITNNITQVERNKTPEELKHEKERAFREECLKVYSNGIMTSEQKRKLEDLQYQLGLDESSADRILSEVAKRSDRKSSTLPPAHQITFNNIKTAINGNQLDGVNRLMAQMKAMVQRYSVEEIQYTYYMLQAVLHPEECVKDYENNYIDNYWKSFWTSIAYSRLGNPKDAFLFDEVCNKWPDAPTDNGLILGAAINILNRRIDFAKSYLENLNDKFSPILYPVTQCLSVILYDDSLSPEELLQMQKNSAFYTKNLFGDVMARVSQKKQEEEQQRLVDEKKRQEEAEAQRIADEKKRNVEVEAHRIAEEQEMRQEAEAKRTAEELRQQEETEARRIAEELQREEKAEAIHVVEKEIEQKDNNKTKHFDAKLLIPYLNKFGYLRALDASEISELKVLLSSAPKDNYKVLFCKGQLYLQENTSAVNQKKAYDAIKAASEHGVYEAGAYMAYFYLYGKVVLPDLDEAERRIKLDDDFKKNPILVQMMVDLYTQKGNAMLADVWKSKLTKLQ